MKLLSKDLLLEFGFTLKEVKNTWDLPVFSRNKFDVVLSTSGEFSYSNQGIEYPVKDLAALKKLYKEVKREDLSS